MAKFRRLRPIYDVWISMVKRCYDPTTTDWHLYGGKTPPITVCERWRQSYEAFEMDMGPRPSRKHTIDRIDGIQGYRPDNCRWASPKEQARNTSRNHVLTFDGRTATIAEWAEIVGMKYMTLFQRINRGMPLATALSKLSHGTAKENARNRISNNRVEFRGESLPVAEWAERYGMTTNQLGQRLRQGWSIERALTTPFRGYRH